MKQGQFHLGNISEEQCQDHVNRATMILSQTDKNTLIGALLATADIVVQFLSDGQHDESTKVAAVFELAASQVQLCLDDEALMGGGQTWSSVNHIKQ